MFKVWRAISSEADAGSRDENGLKKRPGSMPRFTLTGHGSRVRLASMAAAFIVALALLPLPARAQASGPVIFAAASLKTALDAIADLWTGETGRHPAISYASSAVLAKQIEQGAPAAIFISANEPWMDYLAKAKLIRPGSRRDLVSNELVLIEPAAGKSSLKIAPGFDLAGAAGDGKIAVCAINSCPGGIYAKQAFEKLGVWASVEPKLAQADNIRNAMNLVARGEAKFGVVYLSGAKAEPKVRIVDTFPAASHAPIVYPAALVQASTGETPDNPDAQSFFDFMFGPKASHIFADESFTPLGY